MSALVPSWGWYAAARFVVGVGFGANISGGSRIFPRGGGANSQNCYYFSHFCRKLHKNERIWTPRGGARPWRPPLDPPMNMVINCVYPLEFVGRQWRVLCGTIGFWSPALVVLPGLVSTTRYLQLYCIKWSSKN